MTFTQIEKVKNYLYQNEEASCFEDVKLLGKELRAFFGNVFNIQLYVNSLYGKSEYNNQKIISDKASIRSFLDGILSKDDSNKAVLDILNLIDEGENSLNSDEQMRFFVSKVYFSYNDKIKFDKTTEIAATAPSDFLNLGTVRVDENMVAGIINKLRNYGMSLLSQSSSAKSKSNPSVVINNNNTNSAAAFANADIKITIEQAKQQVEDAGFGDQQYKAVMDKLAEIESITNSQESKGGKWKKAKEILKWCTEQGIEIAKIILPLLPLMFNK